MSVLLILWGESYRIGMATRVEQEELKILLKDNF